MGPYDLLEVGHHPVKEEWRSVTTTSGALSVMTHGTIWMLVLLACTLAIATKVYSKFRYPCSSQTTLKTTLVLLYMYELFLYSCLWLANYRGAFLLQRCLNLQ